MLWQYTPYTIPLVLSAAIAVGLALFGWRNRSTPGDVPFVGLMLGVAFWSICYAAGLSVVDLSIKIFWTNLMYLGITAVPGCWLAFTLLYTEKKAFVPKWLFIEPIVTVLMAWTNPFHKLLHTGRFIETVDDFQVLVVAHGSFFWVHVAYSYVLLLWGSILLTRMMVHAPGLYRGQVVAVLIGLLAPWAGNAIYLFGLNPFPYLD